MSVVFKIGGFVVYVAIFFSACNCVFDYPAETLTSAFFKCLPIAHLILVLVSTHFEEGPRSNSNEFRTYRKYIMCGLMLSLVGDVFLVWRFSLFIPGLLMFALAHLCYIAALGFVPFGKVTFVVCAAVGASFYGYLVGAMEDNVLAVLAGAYTALLLTVLWRGLVYAQTRATLASVCACLGLALFVTSDMLIAVDKWRVRVPLANFYIMVTYYAAQLGLTLSVQFHVDSVTSAKKQK